MNINFTIFVYFFRGKGVEDHLAFFWECILAFWCQVPFWRSLKAVMFELLLGEGTSITDLSLSITKLILFLGSHFDLSATMSSQTFPFSSTLG